MRTWLRSPLAILAEDAGGGIVVENDVITELLPPGGQPAAPVDAVFDASEHVVLPGLINTHQHFWQNLTRAHPLGINRKLGAWLQGLRPIWQWLDPEQHRISAELAMTELLMSGCTTVANHHYAFVPGLDDVAGEEFAVADRLGMRLVLARGSAVLGEPKRLTQDEDTILAHCEEILGRHHQTTPGAMHQVALAPSAAISSTRRLMHETAALAERFDCRLHMHLGEAADEPAWCRRTFGYGLVDWLEEMRWLGPRTWLAHGIHFTTDECARLGAHEVGVCHCPTSNSMLASGLCDTRVLEASGSPLGLGSDGGASAGAANIMQEAQHALMLARQRYRDAETTHLDVLRWASAGSARCLGRSDIGAIAVGRQADLALFRLDELRFSGAHDPLAALVISGGQRADRLMIAGQWRLIDGAPPGADLQALAAAHAAAARKFAAKETTS